MKKITNLLLALITVLNLFTFSVSAQASQSPEAKISFPEYSVGDVPAALGISTDESNDKIYYTYDYKIAEDNGSNVLKWTNVNINDTLHAFRTGGDPNAVNWGPNQTLVIPLGKSISFADGIVSYEATVKLPKTGFQITLSGTKTGSTDVVDIVLVNRYNKDSDPPRVMGTKYNTVLSSADYNNTSNGYYTYKFVFDAQTVTESDVEYRYFNAYIKPEGSNTWSDPIRCKTDVLLEKVTAVKFLTAIGNGAQANDYVLDYSIKEIKVTETRLELEQTNIPDGDNPVFSDKNIKLDFNLPVSSDTLSAGIKLYKDNAEVPETDYTLEPDGTDNTVVWLKMNSFPAYNSAYKVTISSELNKNKTGYIKTPDNYSIAFAFHNEQRTDLALTSTTPADGEAYSKRKLTLDFNGSIELESAKQNISVYKGEEILSSGDYTITLDTNDESIVCITLNELPEYSTEEERILYKVVVGTQLNSGCMGYASFPATHTGDSFTFYNEKSSGKVDIDIDFTQCNEETDLASLGVPDGYNAVIGKDGEENVLISSHQNGNSSYRTSYDMDIRLPEKIDIMQGPVSVEMTARVPNSFMSFKILSKDESGQLVRLGYTTGFGNWDFHDYPRRDTPDSRGNVIYKYNGSNLALNTVSANYYTYKFLIDAPSNSVKIYVKAENDDTWSEPFAALQIPLDTELDNISAVRFGKSIGKPADKGGTETEMISWYIKNIKVSQVTTPAVVTTTVADGQTDVSDELSSFELSFNTQVVPESVTKENISVYLVERDGEKLVNDLYDVAVNSDKNGAVITFNDDLGMDKKYLIKVNNLVADTAADEPGKMNSEKVISFETAKKYELTEPTVNTSGANIEISGSLRSYYKASGENSVIVAVLIKSGKKHHTVIHTAAAVPSITNGFAEPTYTLSIEKPDDFDTAEYCVRLYAFDKLEDSQSRCKMFEIPFEE